MSGRMVGVSIPETEALQITLTGNEIRFLSHAVTLLALVCLTDAAEFNRAVRMIYQELVEYPDAADSFFLKGRAVFDITDRVAAAAGR